MAKGIGFDYATRGPGRRLLSFSDSGLLTLSRGAVNASSNITYSDFAGPVDSRVNNGAAYSRVELANGAHLHVFNTHLNSDTSVMLATVPGRFADVRRRQLKQLRAFMDEVIGDDGAAVLVCGDMNIDANNDAMATEYKDMLETLDVSDVIHSKTPARPTLGDIVLLNGEPQPGEQLFTSPSDQMTQQCVDYILFRQDNNGRVRVVRDDVLAMEVRGRPYQRLSDHAAVALHLVVDAN
jgi:endonuclease/exonuclease/phosphatase family metal-dependent hydrolase